MSLIKLILKLTFIFIIFEVNSTCIGDLTSFSQDNVDFNCQPYLGKKINFNISSGSIKHFAKRRDVINASFPAGLVAWLDASDPNGTGYNSELRPLENKYPVIVNKADPSRNFTLVEQLTGDSFPHARVSLMASNGYMYQYLLRPGFTDAGRSRYETPITFNFYDSGLSVFMVFASTPIASNKTLFELDENTGNNISHRFVLAENSIRFARAPINNTYVLPLDLDDSDIGNQKLHLLTLISPPPTAASKTCRFFYNSLPITPNSIDNGICTQHLTGNKLIRIGATRNSGSITQVFDGWMGEVLVFNSPLSERERGLVESYLSNKWNIR